MTDDDRYLQLKTACERFDISYTALYTAVRSAELPAIRQQGSRIWRVKQSDVLAWISAGESNGATTT